jgi:hypothetical protein
MGSFETGLSCTMPVTDPICRWAWSCRPICPGEGVGAAALQVHAAAVYVRGAGTKAHVLVAGLVADVLRGLVRGLLVSLIGRVEVLAGLGGLAALVPPGG